MTSADEFINRDQFYMALSAIDLFSNDVVSDFDPTLIGDMEYVLISIDEEARERLLNGCKKGYFLLTHSDATDREAAISAAHSSFSWGFGNLFFVQYGPQGDYVHLDVLNETGHGKVRYELTDEELVYMLSD